jgi:hypothetical protein
MAIYTPSAQFNRATGTTQYAQGELVANSATAASVLPLKFGLNSIGRAGIIRGARLYKSDKSVTTASFIINLFTADPGVPTNGDNGAFGVASAIAYLDKIAIDLSSGGLAGGTTGVSKRSAAVAIPYCFPNINANLFALLSVDSAYTPADSETFRITLEIEV